MEVAVAQFEAFQNLRAERDDATRKLSERITIDRAALDPHIERAEDLLGETLEEIVT